MLEDGILVGPYTLHEDTFYEHFEPYRHPEAHFDIWGGIGLETFGEDLEIVRRTDPEWSLWGQSDFFLRYFESPCRQRRLFTTSTSSLSSPLLKSLRVPSRSNRHPQPRRDDSAQEIT
jgi:hypothetical protein